MRENHLPSINVNVDPPEPEITAEQLLKNSRGAQLRALILSWHLNETYQNTLQIQATELQNEDPLVISDDWGDIANDILGQFQGQAAQQ